jgi:hypothetical protein
MGSALGIAVAGLVLSALTGCSTGVYKSTPELPATVWIEDVNLHKIIWSMDVPVQHKLALKFDRQGGMWDAGLPATSVDWTLKTLEGDQVATDTVKLPGTAIKLGVDYRAPEMPATQPASGSKSGGTGNPPKRATTTSGY